jgi:hypothetical protein
MKAILVIASCAFLMLSGALSAQEKTTPQSSTRPDANAPTSLTAPGGRQKYPACCESCPAGGCTGCNSGPEGLSCGSGLIKANCQTVNNVVTCVKDD